MFNVSYFSPVETNIRQLSVFTAFLHFLRYSCHHVTHQEHPQDQPDQSTWQRYRWRGWEQPQSHHDLHQRCQQQCSSSVMRRWEASLSTSCQHQESEVCPVWPAASTARLRPRVSRWWGGARTPGTPAPARTPGWGGRGWGWVMAGHQSDGAVGCLKFRDKMGSLGFTCYSHLDNAFILVCAALSSKPSSNNVTQPT